MSPRSLMRRHLSVPLVVSFLALFVALGGAGWAALRLPPNSVGNAQLQKFSVGNAKLRPNSVGSSKIIPGAVGARQVNSSQVQLRVTGACLIGAVQSFSASGNVTCTPALPNEYGTHPQTATLGPNQQQIAAVTFTLGAGLTGEPTAPHSIATVCGDPRIETGKTSGIVPDAWLAFAPPKLLSNSPSVPEPPASDIEQEARTDCGATPSTSSTRTVPITR